MLTAAVAARRLAEDGPNRIDRAAPTPSWRRLVGQLASPLVMLLIAAAVVSAMLGARADAIAIGAIVVIDAIIGFVQEARADRVVLALRAMTAPRARVVRDGVTQVVPADLVVRGDRLVLEAGDLVAADARLIEAHALTTIEAALTGESEPSTKLVASVLDSAPLAERRDTVFLGTSVATGTGLADVVATGMHTELGHIARLIDTARDDETPLERQLSRVGRALLVGCVAIVLVVAALGLARGLTPFDVFLTGVSLAVAAVPEGLPAIVTIALALGVQRMAARHALVRRLTAVGTLGAATVICTDKTGTLTTGVMRARELAGPDTHALLDAAAACCDAELGARVGDPTELAILDAAAARGIDRATIEALRPRTAVEPFDTTSKRMAIRRGDGVLYVKGAIETVAAACVAGPIEALIADASRMAASGLRVLAVASGTDAHALTMLGMIGLADPPRPEAIAAVAAARAAGVTTVMLTGDHPATAQAIAREIGIDEANVHARATPEDKLRLVRAWKDAGEIVAMTGDGVNDAPALREAHVGIAMGRGGTEVTREAADIVLADDDYATIVTAIAAGRGIFENIRKTLVYLLTGNLAELAVMLVAGVVGLPLPLLPLSLLWVNLVTDGLPALALVTDPADPELMTRPPRRQDEPLLGAREWRRIAIVATIESGVVLAVFGISLWLGEVAVARTLALTTLVLCELLRAFAARSATRILWSVGAFSNLRLAAVIALSVIAQLAVVAFPATRDFFGLGAAPLLGVVAACAAGFVPVSVLELAKLARRHGSRRPTRGGARPRAPRRARRPSPA